MSKGPDTPTGSGAEPAEAAEPGSGAEPAEAAEPGSGAEPAEAAEPGMPGEYVFRVPFSFSSRPRPHSVLTFPGLDLKVTNYSLLSYEIAIRLPLAERAINNVAASNPEVAELSQSARADLEDALVETRPTDEQGVIAALQDAARKNPEVARLSVNAQMDLRLKILELIPVGGREALSAIMSMQSAEAVGHRLTRASWALVVATVALVITTAVLVYITAFPHVNQTKITVVVPTPSLSK